MQVLWAKVESQEEKDGKGRKQDGEHILFQMAGEKNFFLKVLGSKKNIPLINLGVQHDCFHEYIYYQY